MLPRNGLVKKSSKNFGNDNNTDSNEDSKYSLRENVNSNNFDGVNMMKNGKKDHHAGYEHNKLPMNKKIGGNINNDPNTGQNNSVMHYGQQQNRPMSYENSRKRSPTTQ